MAETGRQARLFSGTDDTGDLIAHVDVQTAKTAVYDDISHKLDNSWVTRVHGHAVEMRITASGFTNASWFTTLDTRVSGGVSASYHLLFADGDSHTGAFVVETLEEVGASTDRRRFRLVLLSDGAITYAAA